MVIKVWLTLIFIYSLVFLIAEFIKHVKLGTCQFDFINTLDYCKNVFYIYKYEDCCNLENSIRIFCFLFAKFN